MMTAADDEEEVTFDQSTLLTNRLKPQSRKKWCLKVLKTGGVSLAFLALGLCIAIPGPTLIDLMERVNTDTQHISYIFTARSAGYLIGSILGGFLFDRFDQQLLLCVILFFTSIATAAAPWCQTLLALAVMISFQGVSMGFLDTGGNIYCLEIWGKSSGPYMQTLHFCFGVGAFIAPLIAKPFLSMSDPSLNTSSLLHVHPANIPVIVPDYGTQGEINRDPRELPWNHNIYKRDLENDTESNSTFLQTGVSNPSTPLLMTTTTTLAPVPAGPHKPQTSDENSVDETADKDPTKHDVIEPKPPDATPKPSVSPKPSPNQEIPTIVNGSANTPGLVNNTDSKSTLASNTSTTTFTVTTTKPSPTTSMSTTKVTVNPTTSMSTTKVTVNPTTSTSTTKVTVNQGTVTSQAKPTPSPMTETRSNSTAKTSTGKPEEEVTNSSSVLPSSTDSPRKPLHAVDVIVQKTINAIKNMSKIQFAYLIIAVFLCLSSILFMILYCWEKRDTLLTHLHDEDDRGEITEPQGFRVQMLILLFLFYFMYVGMEVTYGGFVMTFAVKAFDWSKSEGSVLTAIFWGAMATGRGIAIFIARCCRPSIMLIVDLVLTLTAAVILSFAINRYHFMLWPGTLLLGLGLSSIFPTGISWAERYMKLTGKATAVMVVGSALGEMVLPVITGYFFQKMDLMALMYVMLTLSIVAGVMFIIMQNLASNRGDRYSMSKFLELDEGETMEMVNSAENEDVEIFNKHKSQRRVKFNLEANGTSYKPLRSSEEE